MVYNGYGNARKDEKLALNKAHALQQNYNSKQAIANGLGKVQLNSLQFGSNMDTEIVSIGNNSNYNKNLNVNKKLIGIEMKQSNELEEDFNGDELYLGNEKKNLDNKETLTSDGNDFIQAYASKAANNINDEHAIANGETSFIAGEGDDLVG